MRVGLRTTSDAFGEWLDRTLDAYRMKRWVYPQYSLVVEDDPKRFHILYRSLTPVVRTMSLPTLGRAFLAELESALLSGRDGEIYARAGAMRVGDATALIPWWVVSHLSKMGRRAEKAGAVLPAIEWVAVEPATGRILPWEPRLDIPSNALDELDRLDPSAETRDRMFVREPTTVDAVFTYLPEQEGFGTVSRAVALQQLSGMAVNLGRLRGRILEGLRRLVAPADSLAMGYGPPRDVLDGIAAAMGGSA